MSWLIELLTDLTRSPEQGRSFLAQATCLRSSRVTDEGDNIVATPTKRGETYVFEQSEDLQRFRHSRFSTQNSTLHAKNPKYRYMQAHTFRSSLVQLLQPCSSLEQASINSRCYSERATDDRAQARQETSKSLRSNLSIDDLHG